MGTYIPLRVRSHYSLLTASASLDRLIEKTRRLELPSLALTDENNLYGAVPFLSKCHQAGIAPILGAIVRHHREEAVLLIRDQEGYANLCTILSQRHLDPEFELAEAVSVYQEGLTILTPQPELAETLRDRLATDHLWLELLRPTTRPGAERVLLDTARRLDIRVVASCDLYLAVPSDQDIHELLWAMRDNVLRSKAATRVRTHHEGYLHSQQAFAHMFRDMPQAVEATATIGESCSFRSFPDRRVFPKVMPDAPSSLQRQSLAGIHSRYGKMTPILQSRFDTEFRLITRKGFSDYFLLVADIARQARALGTPVAGRGSGASSLIAYSLGITNVDPIRYNLPFERFLNDSRRDYPDLDIDFCWRLRDKVIDYVFRKYGKDHVSMISTQATLQPRLAFRDTVKALGLPFAMITPVMQKLFHGVPRSKWGLPDELADIVEQAVRYSRRCNGFPHHLSVHCGGIVVTPDKVCRYAPLQRAVKGVVVTQYDKDAVEAVGLIKLDLLGNRSLSSVAETVNLVRKRQHIEVDIEELPEQDDQVAELLLSSRTVGVNQLESPAMRHLLSQLQPKTVEDVMRVLALIRPGAASLGMKEAFVRRSRQLDDVPELDPRLDPILHATHGIMLYEDDALLIAQALTGLSAGEADTFRRAVSKCRTDEERLCLSKTFLGLCEDNGVDPHMAADLWTQMAKFNAYSFCRAHAASYARLAWANAYMKSRFKHEFWVGALNNNEGMYEKWVYIEEAKGSGIPVLLPCLNHSHDEFSLEGQSIRVGLGRIRELTRRGRRSIFARRPFTDLTDVILRTELRLGELENLIRAGAMDFTGQSRPELLYLLITGFTALRKLRGNGHLFTACASSPIGPPVRDYSPAEKLTDEWDLLQLSTREHPLAYLRPALDQQEIILSRHMVGHVGPRLSLCGMAAAARVTQAGNRGKMCFITLSDEDGLFEASLSPSVYTRHRGLLADCRAGVYRIDGIVEDKYGAISVSVDRIQPLQKTPLTQPTGRYTPDPDRSNKDWNASCLHNWQGRQTKLRKGMPVREAVGQGGAKP